MNALKDCTKREIFQSFNYCSDVCIHLILLFLKMKGFEANVAQFPCRVVLNDFNGIYVIIFFATFKNVPLFRFFKEVFLKKSQRF